MATTKNQEEICKVLVNEIAEWLENDLESHEQLVRLKIYKRVLNALTGRMTTEHAESFSKRMCDMFLLIRQYRTGKETPRHPF